MISSDNSNLTRFFTGLCENVFEARLGIADPPLVDYVSDLMVRFVRFDTLTRVRSPSGLPMHEVVDMLTEAESRVGIARREVHRHIGDVTQIMNSTAARAMTARTRAGIPWRQPPGAAPRRSWR